MKFLSICDFFSPQQISQNRAKDFVLHLRGRKERLILVALLLAALLYVPVLLFLSPQVKKNTHLTPHTLLLSFVAHNLTFLCTYCKQINEKAPEFTFHLAALPEPQLSTVQRPGIVRRSVNYSPSTKMWDKLCPRYRSSIAVVMPFIKRQIPELKENLKSWQKYFPCSTDFLKSFHQRIPRIHLFFFYNEDYSEAVEKEILSIWEEVASYETFDEGAAIGNCFANVSIIFGGLQNIEIPNKYWIGPGIQVQMLYRLFSKSLSSSQGGSTEAHGTLGSSTGEKIDYFFLMEPDTFPVRRDWIDKIFLESTCGNDFYMKGSTFRMADKNHWRSPGDHLNGNALYNCRDSFFADWIVGVIGERRDTPYDLAIRDAFVHSDVPFYRDHAHLFLHVDWIYNYGSIYNVGDKESWVPPTPELINEISPNTYLVHGKKTGLVDAPHGIKWHIFIHKEVIYSFIHSWPFLYQHFQLANQTFATQAQFPSIKTYLSLQIPQYGKPWQPLHRQ